MAFILENFVTEEEEREFFNSCSEAEQLGIAQIWDLIGVDLEAVDKAEETLRELGFWDDELECIKENTKVGEYSAAFCY